MTKIGEIEVHKVVFTDIQRNERKLLYRLVKHCKQSLMTHVSWRFQFIVLIDYVTEYM